MSLTVSPTDPIEGPEIMLRRVPTKWWGPDQSNLPPVKTFFPQKPIPKSNHLGDVDGLSVSREAITPAEKASVAPSGKRYHVVSITASQINAADVSIKSDPQDHDQGHCLLPEINIRDYQESPEKRRWIKEKAAQLAQGCSIVLIIPPGD